MPTGFETLRAQGAEAARAAIRAGAYRRHTAGLAPGRLQANLVVLTETYALDFMRYCQRNPKPCPLVGVTDTGDPRLSTLGDIDLRTDLPSYTVHRDGRPAEVVHDATDLWRGDLVGFALGCSFTFERAMVEAGFDLWHVSSDATVPMFRTSIPTVPAGPFRGEMVVSLRTIPEDRVDEAREISRRYPLAHGAPVHVGNPAEIGIADPAAPDWGDAPPIPEGHVPAFWACGVTPQVALANAAPPFAITHTPGHMLICDVAEDAEVPVMVPKTGEV